jgi:hypothetical protein
VTKKDYVMIAKVLKDWYDPQIHSKWAQLIELLCIKFSANPNFNTRKFKEGCGYHEW